MPDTDPAPLRVLVIDDEPNIRDTLALCIQRPGARVDKVGSGAAALEALRLAPYDLAFCDLRLGSESGLDLIPRLLAERPGLDVVVITAFATFDTAVEAIRRGARDYLPKPFTPAQIRHLARGRPPAAGHRLPARRPGGPPRRGRAGRPARLGLLAARPRRPRDALKARRPHDVSVLLRGESGTGKGVLARALHAASPRRERPFVVVNCPTLSEELLASELFGHARGSFTGAVRDQPGRIEAAEGGTVFLDEIGEISPALQAKLLRFLQEKRFERVGENRTRVADVRVVAATNRDLEAAVKAGRFREDLLYRLNVVEVTVPPLRERTEDILPLARRLRRLLRLAGPARAPGALARPPSGCSSPGPGRATSGSCATPSSGPSSSRPGQVLEPESFPERMAGHVGRRSRRWEATSPSRRWSGSTSCACWPAPPRRTRPPASSGSTPRPSGGSARRKGAERSGRPVAGLAGSVNQKVLPLPASLVTPISPPWARTTSREM